MEEEKLHLQQRLDLEMEQRKHAEGDVQSLALTLRETTEQVANLHQSTMKSLLQIVLLTRSCRRQSIVYSSHDYFVGYPKYCKIVIASAKVFI